MTMRAASSGLVANSVLSPSPAARQRSGSEVQERGTGSSGRSPRALAGSRRRAERLPGWLDASGGTGVLAMDTDSVGASLHIAGLVDHQHRLVVVQMLHHVVTHAVADLVGVSLGPPEHVLCAARVLSPAHSAMVPQFLLGRSDSRPSANFRARRRDSTRVTVPLSVSSGPRTPPASGQGLRCDLRPPRDLQSSHTDDQRWPHPSPQRVRLAQRLSAVLCLEDL